jgi:hypothetical protein
MEQNVPSNWISFLIALNDGSQQPLHAIALNDWIADSVYVCPRSCSFVFVFVFVFRCECLPPTTHGVCLILSEEC